MSGLVEFFADFLTLHALGPMSLGRLYHSNLGVFPVSHSPSLASFALTMPARPARDVSNTFAMYQHLFRPYMF